MGVTESQVGLLSGVVGLASAIYASPLVSATLAVDRKTLLMALLIGFAVSNTFVAVSSSYEAIVASRILGGICPGVMRSAERRVGKECVSTCGSRRSPCH